MELFNTLNLVKNPNRKKQKEVFVPKDIKFPSIINIPFSEFTASELYKARGGKMAFDIECFPNYFLIAFKSLECGKVVTFELSPDHKEIDYNKLNWLINSFLLISFNGNKFDRGLLFPALYGFGVEELKAISDKIILEPGYRISSIESEYAIKIPIINHIDLIEVAPLRASLKTYAGRLNAPRMQDLPYPPEKPLTKDQAIDVKHYCVNDLDDTILLYNDLKDQIKLRENMSVEYKQDLRSLSDAQIAEHVLSSECEKINGYFPRRPKIKTGTIYNYTPPEYIRFQTQELKNILDQIKTFSFIVSENGRPKCEKLKSISVNINNLSYSMGIGGLHSTESKVSHKADNGYRLIDRDVASYYPYIILNNNYYPKHLGKAFLEVYKSIVERRLAAKKLSKDADKNIAEINKKIADSLKITINGSFGKLGSKWSALYSPDLLIQVTVTGQLSLLMLIERLELDGIRVVSANTDGIVIMPHESQYARTQEIIHMWEQITGFVTEETEYKAIYSRDVNNYIAVKKNVKDSDPISKMYKGKGVFGETNLKKQPANEICAKAIASFLVKGIPIETTIYKSKDLKDFVNVRTVKGGAEKDSVYLGKAIRWYYSTQVKGTINYIVNGNKVPNSDGARPIMDLPKTFPFDIDYDYYINTAEEMLKDMGY